MAYKKKQSAPGGSVRRITQSVNGSEGLCEVLRNHEPHRQLLDRLDQSEQYFRQLLELKFEAPIRDWENRSVQESIELSGETVAAIVGLEKTQQLKGVFISLIQRHPSLSFEFAELVVAALAFEDAVQRSRLCQHSNDGAAGGEESQIQLDHTQIAIADFKERKRTKEARTNAE